MTPDPPPDPPQPSPSPDPPASTDRAARLGETPDDTADDAPVPRGDSFGIGAEEIDRLPELPGVYVMRGADGKVLYIGKAANLRSRVRSYFTKGGDARFNVRYLMRHVTAVETVLTSNEKEAFLLEDTLIKRWQPRYNIRLRDDKTYASVRFNLKHEWPRAVVLRRRHEKKDEHLYLGPFASAGAVRESLRLLQRVFPIRSCTDTVLRNRSRPCLLHQIGRCCAPCVLPVDKDEYRAMVEGTVKVLKGRAAEVLADLRAEMAGHSEKMEYERAAAVRDRIIAIEKTVERQLVHQHGGNDRDVIVMQRAGGRAAFTVFAWRNGVLISSRPFIVRDHDREGDELMEEFLSRFYRSEPPPREVICSPGPRGAAFLQEWLTERREAKSELLEPQRGERRRLVDMALENCQKILEQHLSGRRSLEDINQEIMEKFHLESVPDPIECYDISTLQGFATVGAMVTFRQGVPDKSRYRRFKIRSVDGQDDFASLREMLTRRFRKAVEEGDPLPGLVLIDGGKGQLAVAAQVFEELGVEGVGLVSIAKSRIKKRGDTVHRLEERFFLPGRKNPVTFAGNAPALYLLQQARDEAHRFGITFHRELRKKRNLRSSLEDLPGVGKTRAATLLRAFGSLKALRDTTLERITDTPGVPVKVAQTVYEYLHMEDPPEEAGGEVGEESAAGESTGAETEDHAAPPGPEDAGQG